MGASAASGGSSRMVTALFGTVRDAERGYASALTFGYEGSDINLVMSDRTRAQVLAGARSPELHRDAESGAEKFAEGAELGGPIGATLGTIAPVLAAVGALVLAPGLMLAGPVAAALAAAGALALSGDVLPQELRHGRG